MSLLVKALSCKKCGAPLKSRKTDLVMFCPSCKSYMEFLDTDVGSVPVKILSPKVSLDKTVYIPFWKISAEILVSHEKSSGSFGNRTPMRGRQEFYICGVNLKNSITSRWNYEFTINPPVGTPVSEFGRAEHLAADKTSKSAEKNAEFVFLKHEVKLSGTLQEIEYTFQVLEHEVVYLPFVCEKGSYTSAW